jgi:hypothetical protein
MPLEWVHSAVGQIAANVDLHNLAVELGIEGGGTSVRSFIKPGKSTLSKYSTGSDKFGGTEQPLVILTLQGTTGIGRFSASLDTYIWVSHPCKLRVFLDSGEIRDNIELNAGQKLDMGRVRAIIQTVWCEVEIPNRPRVNKVSPHGITPPPLREWKRIPRVEQRHGTHSESEISDTWGRFRRMKNPEDYDKPEPKMKGWWDLVTGNVSFKF